MPFEDDPVRPDIDWSRGGVVRGKVRTCPSPGCGFRGVMEIVDKVSPLWGILLILSRALWHVGHPTFEWELKCPKCGNRFGYEEVTDKEYRED